VKIALLNVGGRRMLDSWPSSPPEDIDDVTFVVDDVNGADHVVAMNGARRQTQVFCEPDRVWMMVQEPPDPLTAHHYHAQPAFARIYVPDALSRSERHRHYWGALEPHIGKTYDELAALAYPEKSIDLVWVTSSQTYLPGHRKRMAFLTRLVAAGVPLELWGRGFRELPVKWDVLSKARYAIAFENHGGGIYWSEKLSDCFLGYATPLYYGARDIDRYFPPKSYVAIDPDDPLAPERMRDIVASRFHEENREALEEARDLCLNKYNPLFFIAREAKAYQSRGEPKRWITLFAQPVEAAQGPWHLLDVAIRDMLRPLLPGWLLSRYRQWMQNREMKR
jgi:hypothetical protein